MTTHSSILAWEISWTEEPDGLQSVLLQSQTRLRMYACIFMREGRELFVNPVILGTSETNKPKPGVLKAVTTNGPPAAFALIRSTHRSICVNMGPSLLLPPLQGRSI